MAGRSGGDFELDLINAFILNNEFQQNLEFEPLDNELPAVMKDQHGNYWDIFGFAIEGPNSGERLNEARSYTGYWYALADFYPGIQLYQN